jgi:predicted GIY-YIG superfamily endonuclease
MGLKNYGPTGDDKIGEVSLETLKFGFGKIIKSMPRLFDQLSRQDCLERKKCSRLPKKGVYVFFEDSKAIYVGRSKNIPKRILTHGRPSCGHNSASFAFLLAKEQARKLGLNTKMSRAALQKNSRFNRIYKQQKERVARMKVKAVAIPDAETEAIFEIYASRRLGTRYNEFNTH